MSWKKLNITCPNCGEYLYEDTSTGEVVCLSNCSDEE